MKKKFVKDSCVETTDIVHPSDVNAYNIVFGGHMISLLDKAACISAVKHSQCRVTTVSMDGVRFYNPAGVGTILDIKASVNRAFNTSMEVGLKVTGTFPEENMAVKEICHAYMTFVAIDENGRPTPIQPIVPQTAAEKRRYEEAGIRREMRIKLANKLKK